MNLKLLLILFNMLNLILGDKIATFPGTLLASNYSTQFSHIIGISVEECALKCLSNIDCVAFLIAENCSIYTFDQLISVQNVVSANETVGIKINGSDSETCPSSFSSLNLTGSVRELSYEFITTNTPGLFNFSQSSCPNDWKLFRRVRGYYCIKPYFFDRYLIYNKSFCNPYSSYLSGFDNQNEVDYIYTEMINEFPDITGAESLAIDGNRNISCYNNTTISCNDFEWTNNYSSYPTFINWNTGQPSGETREGIQENCLAFRAFLGPIYYANDIICSDKVRGYVCGKPVGDWDE
ncbi:unnamed protein product [Caenorhabditis angaria]|uniref:C-type lectin domain-containing protein n=1 Tax=Caenorhabditis angaria TaxID=860376 RepID=A0A9P1ICH6_9PELO|nr:unnamed protein product [Caenorhabditis angaria]